jgi:glutathione S-transferase
VPFTDRRYAQHFNENDMQWDRSDWLNEKFNLGLEFPNLPYLLDEDVKLTETLAIMKYVAKKWKPELLGRNAAEVGRVNMLEYHVYTLKFA